MTSGERMVWAAEFVRALEERRDPTRAAERAHAAVVALRFGVGKLGDEARSMVDDMLEVSRSG